VHIGSYSQVMGVVFVLIPFTLCPDDYRLLIGGFVMYFTYFILFAQLYYDMYLRRPEGDSGKRGGEPKKVVKVD
jgi:hypothetical protein